jgi:hypothetical protein
MQHLDPGWATLGGHIVLVIGQIVIVWIQIKTHALVKNGNGKEHV